MSKAFNIATNLGAYQSAFDSSGDLTAPNITTDSISAANLSIPPSTSPGSPSQGDLYLDISDDNLKIYNGTIWKNIPEDLSNTPNVTGKAIAMSILFG